MRGGIFQELLQRLGHVGVLLGPGGNDPHVKDGPGVGLGVAKQCGNQLNGGVTRAQVVISALAGGGGGAALDMPESPLQPAYAYMWP